MVVADGDLNDEAAPWTDVAHTGPGTLAGRYLRSFWQPIWRAHDLSPGRALPLQVMSQQLTLYRGASGEVHLVAFRCAHRGTQLSTGWVEGDNLRALAEGRPVTAWHRPERVATAVGL